MRIGGRKQPRREFQPPLLCLKKYAFLLIKSFGSKINLIKKKANLEDDLNKLNISLDKSSGDILKGINLLRLGNNPIKITGEDILKIISDLPN